MTQFLQIKNRAVSTLASGIDDAVESLDVAAGAKFPQPGNAFHITIDDEILKCTVRSTDTLTVTRAQEGTIAAAHSAGATVSLNVTAGVIAQTQDHEALTTGVHGVGAGTVAKTADIPAMATPAIVLGATPAAGSAATLIRSDATVEAFDTTVPTTQAFGDSAGVGTVAKAARRDHKHAMMANPVPAATAQNNFIVSDASPFAWIKKTLAEVKTILGLGTAAYTAATAYVTHALATAANDFLVASGSGAFVKKTLAETLTILGKAVASGLASLDASSKVAQQPASITDHLGTTPSTQAFGDSAAGGAATTTSKNDHKHAMMALPAIDATAAATDITTRDVSTSAHGLAPKAVAPAAGLLNVYGIANAEAAIANKAIFDTTNPAALGTAAPGTQVIAARRDHVHTNPVPAATAESDFIVANSTPFAWLKKTLAEVKTILGLGTAAYTAATAYVTHALATAANDFIVASGSGAYIKKTLAETLTILGKAAASGLASLDGSSKVVQQPASISDFLETAPTNIATKAPASSYVFGMTRKNAIINGTGIVNQRVTALTLVKDTYGIAADRFYGMATGTAVSAGTFNNIATANCGVSGYAFKFIAVTLTGTGVIWFRYRMEAKDAVRFKNQTASFQCQVYQDTGGAINYTIYVRKASGVSGADDFSGVTVILNSGAISVPNATATSLPCLAIAMGDCSNGIEIEIKVECGAITTKNFEFTSCQFEPGSVATPFEFRPFQQELALCQRYSYQMNSASPNALYAYYGTGAAHTTTVSNVFILFPVEMRTAPTLIVSSDHTKFRVVSLNAAHGVSAGGIVASQPCKFSVVLTVTHANTVVAGDAVNFGAYNDATTWLLWIAEL